MPSWTFGIVADVQHSSTEPEEMYQTTLDRLDAAIADWNARKAPSDIRFIANMGDAIEGGETEAQSASDMQNVLARFAKATPPVCHILGNHCYTNNPAAMTQLGLEPPGYYARAEGGWTFLFLNTTELSLLPAYASDSALKQEVDAFLEANPLKSRPELETYNGGVSKAQLQWLDQQLAAAEERRVVVMTHHPLFPYPGAAQDMAWNADAIRDVLEQHPTKVHTAFSGHHHTGGYQFWNGIHYLTLRAMLSHPDASAYTTVSIDNDTNTVTADGGNTSQPSYKLVPGLAFVEPPAAN